MSNQEANVIPGLVDDPIITAAASNGEWPLPAQIECDSLQLVVHCDSTPQALGAVAALLVVTADMDGVPSSAEQEQQEPPTLAELVGQYGLEETIRRTCPPQIDKSISEAVIEQEQRAWGLLVQFALEPTEKLLAQIVSNYEPLVRQRVRKLQMKGVEDDDYYQQGMVGLIRALRRFDPLKGTPVFTYIIPCIDGEMKRYHRDRGALIKVTRRVYENSAQVLQCAERLAQTLKRDPADAEVANALGLPEALVAEIRIERHFHRTASGDDPRSSYVFENAQNQVGQAPVSTEDTALTHVEVERNLSRLDARTREIIELYFFGQLTQVEIAKRLGCSQVHISRLFRAGLDEMRANADSPELD